MNDLGKKYIRYVNNLSDIKNYVNYKPNNSQIYERIMRLGIEQKVYELLEEDFAPMAIATLKQDFYKNLMKNLKSGRMK